MKKNLKKIAALGLALTVTVALAAGCGTAGDGNGTESSKGNTKEQVITVGASVSPHAEILEQVKPILEAEGYTLEIVEYNDYNLPNTAVEDGTLDANFFQHQPFLDSFNENNGTNLVSVAEVHFEPLGIYSEKFTGLGELEQGDIVALPNDATNEGRALLLLEANGLITLKSDAGVNATILDIEENPYELQFQEIAAEQLVRALPDVAIACINGNYAIEGGYSVTDAIAVEDAQSLSAETYANILAVKEEEKDSEKIQALVKALLSDEVRQYIEENYDGAVIPVF